MFKLSLPNLQKKLKDLSFQPQVQADTNQVYIVLKQDKQEWPLFFRILHDGELLQMVAFIPTNYIEKCQADLCRFLLMLNKELDMPGFCIDEGSKTIFYRLILPSHKKEISDETFEAFLNTTQTVILNFAPVIEAIGVGAMTVDEVLKKAQELKA